MKVILQNYIRGQTVFHSNLVVLKGQLVFGSGEEEQSGLPSAAAGSCAVPFDIRHRRCQPEFESGVPYKIYRGRFVALLNLEVGANQINFCDKENGTVFDNFELVYQEDTCINEHYIRVLYVSCAKSEEGGLAENRKDRILPKLYLGLSLVQTLFAEKLYENGFDRRSFKLLHGMGSSAEFPISLSAAEIAHMSTSQLWEYIAKEIRAREDTWDKRCKYVAFVANSWKVHYEHHQQNTKLDSATEKLALGGGGLAVIGTSFLDTWPFSVETVLDTLFSNKKLESLELETCAARFGAVDR